MISIPEEFAYAVARAVGEAGREWVEDLPRLVDSLCDEWGLILDGAPMHGHLGLVFPVRRAGEPRVLKVVWADESSAHEALALSVWDGRGAVYLHEAHPESGAMLLERLDGGRSLNDVRIEEAVAVSGRLLRRHAIPAPDGFPRLREFARHLSETFPERWERMGRPMPRELLDEARDLAAELGPSAADLLVNYDLHYGNVLAGEREPWLVIDPKAIAGDPEFGLAQLLWRRLDYSAGKEGLRWKLRLLAETAELDPELVRSWTLVRCVDYWLWALGIGLTYDPKRCEAIIGWLP